MARKSPWSLLDDQDCLRQEDRRQYALLYVAFAALIVIGMAISGNPALGTLSGLVSLLPAGVMQRYQIEHPGLHGFRNWLKFLVAFLVSQLLVKFLIKPLPSQMAVIICLFVWFSFISVQSYAMWRRKSPSHPATLMP